jgi:hypothetical protein
MSKLHLRHELEERGPIFCKAAESRATRRTSDAMIFLAALHAGTGCLNCLDKAIRAIFMHFKGVSNQGYCGHLDNLPSIAALVPTPCCLHEPHHGGCTEHAGPCPVIDPRADATLTRRLERANRDIENRLEREAKWSSEVENLRSTLKELLAADEDYWPTADNIRVRCARDAARAAVAGGAR